MIKILTIATSHFDTGGITKVILNYYKNIDKNKFRIDFVVPNELPEDIKQEFINNGSKYYILKNRKKNPIKYINNLIKIVKTEEYQIVHAHGNSATMFLEMYAAYRAGCKVRIAHSHNSTCIHKFVDKLLRPFFYKYCNNAFACGELAGKWLFGNRKFIIIPNGNDIEKFSFNENKRKEIRTKYDLQNKKVLGHVGRFNDQKNQEFVIDVFYEYYKNNKNAVLVLVGSGMYFNRIQDKVKALGIQESVIFTNEIQNVEDWLCACDIMLLPSKYEGFPVVLIEWQISGLPCLVSDRVTKEIKMTNLVKFISLDESPKYWAEEINKIEIKDRNLVKDKIINKIKLHGYDIKDNAKKLEDIYENMIEEVKK